jgi:hypothetical protein
VAEAVVEPENMRSLGAAAAICEAIEELGPEWKARLEGPRADEDEYRSIPGAPTEWADITAQVWGNPHPRGHPGR